MSYNRTHTVCKCNHLTGFANLMDFHNYTVNLSVESNKNKSTDVRFIDQLSGIVGGSGSDECGVQFVISGRLGYHPGPAGCPQVSVATSCHMTFR